MTRGVTLPPLPAIVLCAGVASRLSPLSTVRAKAAAPVAGVPMIRRILQRIASWGVRDVVINLHHLPHTITSIVGDGADVGLAVRYSWEPRILGSAGGPRKALSLIDADRALIVNGDTLTDLDAAALIDAHARSGALVTMALIPNPRPDHYGSVLLDADGRVTGFARAGEARSGFHYIGVQVIEARALAEAPVDEPRDTVKGMYPALIAREPGSIHGVVGDAAFEDIGTPADLLAASLAAAARDGRPGALIGSRCRIAASAQIVRSVLWDDVTIEDGVVLTDCIVADGVRVRSGRRIERAAIVRAYDRESSARAQVADDLLVVPV